MSIGSFSTGNYVSFGNPAQYGLTGPFAVSAWVNLTDVSVDSIIMSKWLFPAAKGFIFYFRLGFPALRFTSDGSDATVQVIESPVKPVVGTWTHFIASYTGSVIFLMINGVETTTEVAYTGSVYNSSASLVLASFLSPAVTTLFSGSMSDVRLWNRGLSKNEALEIHARKGRDNNIYGQSLRTALNTRVRYDHSQYANNGTITGSLSAFSDPISANNDGMFTY